jgi:hypothetical protein
VYKWSDNNMMHRDEKDETGASTARSGGLTARNLSSAKVESIPILGHPLAVLIRLMESIIRITMSVS